MRKLIKTTTSFIAIMLLFTACGLKRNSLGDQGKKAQFQGQHKKAVNLFTNALKQKKDHYTDYLNRANSNRKLGRPLRAIADYSCAIQLKPKTSDKARLARAELYFASKMYHQAQNDVKEVLSKDANNINALYIMGMSHFKLKKYNKAIPFLKKVLTKNSMGSEKVLASSKAMSFSMFYLKKYSKAMTLYEDYFIMKKTSHKIISEEDWYWRGTFAQVNSRNDLQRTYWNNLSDSFKRSKQIH